jgi:DNA-binding MarR family transcriptional regulator
LILTLFRLGYRYQLPGLVRDRLLLCQGSQKGEMVVVNTIFRKGLGFAPETGPGAEIDEIQRQLDSLRARLIGAQNTKVVLDVRDRARLVRNFCHARQIRREAFGQDLFSDPAWDILLELYLAELEQRRLSVGNIGASSAIPATTTIRWLTKLEEVGLAIKRNDPLDGRRVWVSLTDNALKAMNGYLDGCWPLLS